MKEQIEELLKNKDKKIIVSIDNEDLYLSKEEWLDDVWFSINPHNLEELTERIVRFTR
jgi:hypothetical protein